MSLKANDIQFTEFQRAVLDRMVDRDGKKGFIRDAMSYRDWSRKTGEEREVKMNLRFLSKAEHTPVVQFNLHCFVPDPKDISKRCTSIQSRSLVTEDKSASGGSTSPGPAEIVPTDSVLTGVFAALDYDKDMLNKIR